MTSDGVAPTSDWCSSKEIISSVYLVATPQNFPFYRLQQEKDGFFFFVSFEGVILGISWWYAQHT